MRVNLEIDAREVFLIDDKGDKLGNLPIEEALGMAGEQRLDLVEVAPTNGTRPPVCKLMDYGRHSYQIKKKRTEAKTKHRSTLVKMIKFRPNTYEGDYKVKVDRIRHFIEKGDKVKVVMQFRGREIIYAKNSYDLFNRVAKELSDVASVDSPASSEGRFINMLLAPLPSRLRKKNGNGSAETDESSEVSKAKVDAKSKATSKT